MANKTYICVKFEFEGFHHWPEAPNEVDFLRKPHRHLFKGEAKIPVAHNDRQLEYFIVKRFLNKTIKDMYDFELGKLSCEMMCEDVLKAIQDKFGVRKDVTVSIYEDGENGSVVTS